MLMRAHFVGAISGRGDALDRSGGASSANVVPKSAVAGAFCLGIAAQYSNAGAKSAIAEVHSVDGGTLSGSDDALRGIIAPWSCVVAPLWGIVATPSGTAGTLSSNVDEKSAIDGAKSANAADASAGADDRPCGYGATITVIDFSCPRLRAGWDSVGAAKRSGPSSAESGWPLQRAITNTGWLPRLGSSSAKENNTR